MLTIRPYRHDDTASLIALMIESHHFYNEIIPTPESICHWLGHLPAGTEMLVAENTNKCDIIGFAGIATLYPGPQSEPQLYLKELYVKDRLRNQGIGKLFMLRILQIARERGYRRVDWTVNTSNIEARKFYRGIGADELPKILCRLADEQINQAIAALTVGDEAQ